MKSWQTLKEAAEKESLAIMGKGDLADLLERVRAGDKPEQLLSAFRSKIIQKGQSMLFRRNLDASILQATMLFRR